MLRLDWNILFTVINLLILYVLMKHFLLKPVNGIIEKRRQEAGQRFAEAEEEKADALREKSRYEELLQETEDEKERILEQARQEALEEYGRIVKEAEARAEGILEKARVEAEAEKTKVLQQTDLAVKEIAVAAIARMMAEKESPESDHALYDKFLAQAGTNAQNGNA